MLETFWGILISYLWGSLSPTNFVARWRRGIDLRAYGSGNVGGMNLGVLLGKRWAVAIGALDWAKGLLPALVARLVGADWTSVVLISLATVVGHDWSLYLGFKGGRGVAATIGLLFAWDLRLALLFLAIITIGWVANHGAPSCMIALVLLAPVAWLIAAPMEIVWGSVALLVITIIKRLEANRLPLPRDAREKRLVLLRRLWLDRDIESDREWQERGMIQ